MKLDKICRTCLLEKANLRPLFEDCIANMLMTCASVQVIQGDGLPHQVCTQCLQSINKAYTFKQLCEKSDMTIRNYLSINLQPISLPADNIINEVKSDLFSTSEVLQQSSLFQDIFNDATTHSLVETFTNQNASTDLAETMQSLQTIAEQCLPESWESDGNIVPCNSDETSDNFLGPIYKCEFCENIFKDEWSLGEHMKNHSGQPKYFCNICRKICDTSNELDKHLIDHTFVNNKNELAVERKQDFTCDLCDGNFSNSKYLKRHLKELHFLDTGSILDSDKKFGCNLCGKRISLNQEELRISQMLKRSYSIFFWSRVSFINLLFKIGSTSIMYRQNKLLVMHMRSHTGERPLNCEICGRNFALPSSLHKHRNIHIAEKKYECNICNRKFNQSSNLNEHLRTHTGQKSYICSVCGKSFTTNASLYVHMRIHTGVKPYSCSFCQMSFTTSTQMKKHQLIHTGEKPYPCWQCGRSFRRKETRDTHVRYHTGERPYSCDICSKKYVAASHLRDHMKSHNNNRKFECMICPKKFLDSKTLKSHMLTHTGQKPYSCQFCGKHFSQNGGLVTHIKNCHNNQ
ncbi:uncharacterized protein isoform X2 [Leptinotarsa decemlineata]|uniref:uncharacterized protein isoform X2 n=1 Tax=Leptinotarsa decemlineata TaxID=7539 RepID=UPI003D30CE79